MTPEQRQEMIDRIRQLPAELEAAVSTLSDDQLDTPYRQGGWTVRQVVHHLVDSHINAMVRMKLLLTEDNPTIKPYDQEEWAKLPDTREMPIADSLMTLRGLHRRWCYLLDRTAEGDWQRKGYHPESGELILEDFLKIYSRHGENHLRQITTLKEKMNW